LYFCLGSCFTKPNPSGLKNGGLVPYFQVVSLWAFCRINDSTCYLLKKKKKKNKLFHLHMGIHNTPLKVFILLVKINNLEIY
jgi:hypothetical protein